MNILKQIDFLSNYVSIHVELSQTSKDYLTHFINNIRFNYLMQQPLCENVKNGLPCNNLNGPCIYRHIKMRQYKYCRHGLNCPNMKWCEFDHPNININHNINNQNNLYNNNNNNNNIRY